MAQIDPKRSSRHFAGHPLRPAASLDRPRPNDNGLLLQVARYPRSYSGHRGPSASNELTNSLPARMTLDQGPIEGRIASLYGCDGWQGVFSANSSIMQRGIPSTTIGALF